MQRKVQLNCPCKNANLNMENKKVSGCVRRSDWCVQKYKRQSDDYLMLASRLGKTRPNYFFLNQRILFIVSAMSTAETRSNTLSTSLCNAIATYS